MNREELATSLVALGEAVKKGTSLDPQLLGRILVHVGHALQRENGE